jgi:hypothetical protein
MNTATDSLETNTPKTGGGFTVGQSASDLVGFYGATPIAQPSGSAQAAVTDASGGTAAATNGILTLTGTYNSTILANAIATLAAQSNALRNALVSVGIIKGSA